MNGMDAMSGELKMLFSPECIAARVKELAADINELYGQEPLVAICVLKGSVIFFSDLVRELHNKNLELDFLRLSSYGMGDVSSGHPVLSKDIDADVSGKHVLIVEDMVDSGHSMRWLLDNFAARNVRSLRLVALIDKRERREVYLNVDFAGFMVNRGFLVGYGMDYAEHWRTLPGVCEVVQK